MKKIGLFETRVGYIHKITGDSFELQRKYKGKVKINVLSEKGSYEFVGEIGAIAWFEEECNVEVYVEEIQDLDKYEFKLERTIIEDIKL